MTTTWKRIRKVDGGFIFSRYTPWSLGVAKTPSHPLAPRKTPISQRPSATPRHPPYPVIPRTPSSSAVPLRCLCGEWSPYSPQASAPVPSVPSPSVAFDCGNAYTSANFLQSKATTPPLPWGGSSAFTSPTPKKFPDLWGVFTGRTPIFGRYRVGSGGIIRLADDVFGGGSADLRCGSVDFLVPYTIL